MNVIDLEIELPGGGPDDAFPGQELPGPPGPDRLPPPPDYGWGHYATIFAGRDDKRDQPALMSTAQRADELVRLMDEAGVVRGCLNASRNAVTVEAVRRHPDRLIGICSLSPYDGMRAVRELERLVHEDNIRGLAVSALYDMVPASDRRYYPLYAKCVELGIPVRVYTAMTYASDRPYELGHPRHLDQVAMDFPELTVIAGLAGWPWVNEMVGLLRRHGNLFCDTAAHRPRHFATPGSGWQQFLQFGNTLLQDKVMVGLSWTLFELSMSDLIGEYLDLPLKDSVKEKWLYSNAARILGVE